MNMIPETPSDLPGLSDFQDEQLATHLQDRIS